MREWIRMKPAKHFLSEEQHRAVGFFGKDLCVSAGAGSGKTTVLVERYLWMLLHHHCLPQNILAVTFTDKAANEMKKRLVARCEEMKRPDIRRQLESAWIGTIHSFCARILKEYPIECGLDPDFSVLGAGEAEILSKKTLDRLFEEQTMNAAWISILKDCGEEKLRKELTRFYDLYRAGGACPDLLHLDTLKTESQACERQLVDRLGQLSQEKRPSATPAETRFHETVLELLSCLKDDTLSGWRKVSRFSSIADALKANSPAVRQAVTELRALRELWQLYEVQSLSEPWKREFVAMFFKYMERLEEEKKKTFTYDFEDLLFFVHRALSGSSDKEREFRSHLQSLFSYILVDEYQDTSPLQAKIISLLKSADNLFVVGDARQSIYGFRHASPEVFIEASQGSENISLAENYRARPELLDFVNRFSSRLFSSQYQPLKAILKFSSQKDHVVELISVPRQDGKELASQRVIEARTIASRIRHLVDSGFAVEEKNGKTRPATYRDFAILMKSTTSSRLYEKELEAFSVPYYAHKGRGFYEKMEVADLLNALQVLEDPGRDICLASVLRSPLAQLSDDALFWLATKRLRTGEQRFCAGLKNLDKIPELSDKDREKMTYFNLWMEDLRKNKDALRISEILQKITEVTAYEAKLLTSEGGLQARANVQKLHEIARMLEQKGVSGIEDFVLYLKNLSDREITEPEARLLGEAENVVRILTIHAAKGLEFPCVILADMGAKRRSSESPNFYADLGHGLGAQVKNPVDFQFYKDKTYHDIEKVFVGKQLEEQSRLFYVAMTRAKEHLILSGVCSSGSWMEETLQHLGLQTNVLLDRRLEFEGIPVEVVPIYRELAPKKSGMQAVLADDTDVFGPEPLEVQKLKKILEPVAKPYETIQDLSVTQLLISASAVKQAVEETADLDPEEPLSTPRNEFGAVFHKIMEIAASNRPRGLWQENFFSRCMRTFSAAEKSEIRESFDGFWKGEWGKKLGEATHCYTELPFIFKTRHGILKGQIDLVFRDRNGQWVILDYKTNRISKNQAASTAETYRWQLAIYALVFGRLYGQMPKCGVLYFSALHHAHEFHYDEKDFERFASELEIRYHRLVLQESS